MQAHQDVRPETDRLRFVFGDHVVSLAISRHATFEDVARKFARLTEQRGRLPVAIDIKLTPMPSPTAQRVHKLSPLDTIGHSAWQ